MADPKKAERDSFGDLRLQELKRLARALHRIERKGRLMLGITHPVGITGLLLLEMGGIGQEHCQEVAGRRRGVHRAAKSLLHELGKITGVIDVRVSEDDGAQILGAKRQRGPVAEPVFLESLEEAAVEQELIFPDGEEKLRAGDRGGGAEKV